MMTTKRDAHLRKASKELQKQLLLATGCRRACPVVLWQAESEKTLPTKAAPL